jgi:hypothetical protein
MTYDQAKERAQRRVDGISGGPYVITKSREFDIGWAFFWDFRQRQESGSFRDVLLGNSPILIDRESGEFLPTGTARPVEAYVAAHAERKRHVDEGWPDSLDARFLALLALVRDGMGRRHTRYLGLLIGMQREPRDGRTVLDELAELEWRGLVRRQDDGARCRWALTDAGLAAVS